MTARLDNSPVEVSQIVTRDSLREMLAEMIPEIIDAKLGIRGDSEKPPQTEPDYRLAPSVVADPEEKPGIIPTWRSRRTGSRSEAPRGANDLTGKIYNAQNRYDRLSEPLREGEYIGADGVRYGNPLARQEPQGPMSILDPRHPDHAANFPRR